MRRSTSTWLKGHVGANRRSLWQRFRTTSGRRHRASRTWVLQSPWNWTEAAACHRRIRSHRRGPTVNGRPTAILPRRLWYQRPTDPNIICGPRSFQVLWPHRDIHLTHHCKFHNPVRCVPYKSRGRRCRCLSASSQDTGRARRRRSARRCTPGNDTCIITQTTARLHNATTTWG